MEDYLLGFPGPILAVSHDRFFLDKLAESIFEVRGDGEIHRFTGNWTDWQAKRRAEEAPSPKAEKPKPAAERPRERKLKFTFKEQREFETIDADLAELEAQITACQTEQESCGSDYVKLQELQARQAELEAFEASQAQQFAHYQQTAAHLHQVRLVRHDIYNYIQAALYLSRDGTPQSREKAMHLIEPGIHRPGQSGGQP